MRPRPLLAPVLALLLLAGACSSSSDPAGNASGTSAPPASDGTSPSSDGSGADDDTGTPASPWPDHHTDHYDDPDRWLCHPDRDDDACDTDLDTTVLHADGSREILTFEADPDAPIDCFYVYPTISRDPSRYSDWDPSPDEEGWVTVQQAARLGSVCRVFAPVHRQRTMTALVAGLSGDDGPEDEGDPYADVLDAFRTYLARDNDGRGFVLVGHSQGAGILARLLADEFDGNPELTDHLVAAHLAGTSLAVPEGERVGGALTDIPLCTETDDVGCVLTWSTYARDEVPDDGIFGRRDPDGVPAGCVNPADPVGGSAPLTAHLPAARGASILGPVSDGAAWIEDDDPVTTPFVSLPGLIHGTCVDDGNLTYLEISFHPDPDDPRSTDIGGRLTPDWGLHLLDVNLVMGDLVDDVGRRGDRWVQRR